MNPKSIYASNIKLMNTHNMWDLKQPHLLNLLYCDYKHHSNIHAYICTHIPGTLHCYYMFAPFSCLLNHSRNCTSRIKNILLPEQTPSPKHHSWQSIALFCCNDRLVWITWMARWSMRVNWSFWRSTVISIEVADGSTILAKETVSCKCYASY